MYKQASQTLGKTCHAHKRKQEASNLRIWLGFDGIHDYQDTDHNSQILCTGQDRIDLCSMDQDRMEENRRSPLYQLPGFSQEHKGTSGYLNVRIDRKLVARGFLEYPDNDGVTDIVAALRYISPTFKDDDCKKE